MLEAVGGFLGRISVYITALLGVIALYFLWVAFREWRASTRAVFGVERDVASSEMIGAVSRAGIFVVAGVLVLGLGWFGQQSESDEEIVQATRAPSPTLSLEATLTPGIGQPTTTVLPSGTPQPEATDVRPLPPATTAPPPPVEPTPQTATVAAFGGVWLRDAPNGGTIVVLLQDTVVELLEGRETAGNFEWQKVRVLNTPPGSEAQAEQEGWVAAQFLQIAP
jgi:hypothetical protein